MESMLMQKDSVIRETTKSKKDLVERLNKKKQEIIKLNDNRENSAQYRLKIKELEMQL